MHGGTISSNTATSYGGGVYMTNSSAFNMSGGSITGNSTTYYHGGGVYVDVGTFTMSDTASISSNTATGHGGGVHLASSIAEFTMSGGTISSNSATEYGGGVSMSYGTFNMTGGTIGGAGKGNTAANGEGGGVYMSGGTFNISGSPVITGNTDYYSENNNVYLADGKFMVVNGVLTENENTNIGVKMAVPGVFAKYGGEITDLTEYLDRFTSDDPGYKPAVDDKKLKLAVPHTHGDWTYSYTAHGSSDGFITATCGNEGCPLSGASTPTCLVNIDTNAKYSSSSYACPVSIPELRSAWEQARLATPTVTDNGLTAGTLNGSVTLTVNRESVINGENISYALLPADNAFTNPPAAISGLEYTGSAQNLITAGTGAQGTVWYKLGENSQYTNDLSAITATDADDYIVYFYVDGGEYYQDIDEGSIPVTIGKGNITPVVSITGWTYGENANDPSVTGNTGNGTVTYYYKAQGADDNTYTTEVPSEVGNYTVKATIAEASNYKGASVTADFSITYASMTAQEAFGYTYDPNAWVNTDITFTAKDGYTVSTTADGDYSNTIKGTEEGLGFTKTVYVKEDSTGKVSQVELKYNLDKTAPVSAASRSGSQGENGWYVSWVTVQMSGATDSGSGIAKYEYSTDGGNTWTALDSEETSFTVKEEGDHTDKIQVRVTDKAGNVSEVNTVTAIKIDLYAPVISSVAAEPSDWTSGSVTLHVDATDSGSGIEAYKFGDGEWQTDNSKVFAENGTVTVSVKDNAGQISSTTYTIDKIDKTKPGTPVISAKVGNASYASGNWTAGNVVIDVSATDVGSEIKGYRYSVDGESWTYVEGETMSLTHSENTDATGVTYRFVAVDMAGNVSEASGSITVKKRQPYTIAFNANSGTGNMDSLTAYVDTQIELTENAFTRVGYTFAGWNTAADGSGTAYADKENVTNLAEMNQTAILYAQWTVNEYKVTWINYGGDGWEKDFDYGESITLPTIPDFAIMMQKLGYTQTGWLCSDDTVGIGDTMPAKDLTFTAQYTPNTYTVKFDANGGTGEMADQSFTYDAAQALTANTFTREGYKFVGWAESTESTGVNYVDKQVVSNLNAAPNGEVILYAVWTRDIILSGDISAENVPIDKLSVILRGLDGTVYPVSVTGSQSPYHYTVAVPEGEYQLIVKDTRNSVTITAKITAKEELTEDKTENITMPEGSVNSIVDSTAAGDYTPIVGGLDDIAGDVANENAGVDVTVTLTVTHEPDVEDAEHDALMDAAGSQKSKLTFLEIDLEKNVNGNQSAITQTDDVIEIVIPFDTTRKQNFKVYRFHDDNENDNVDEDEVDILTTTANGDGEYIIVGTGSVTIHAKFFSLYAIGYTDVIPYYPVTHSCTSKCDMCGGCEDAACTENACEDKCLLLGMNFTDVAEGKWYTEPVEYVYHHKMMEGVGNNLFDINGTTSRAIIVTILWRLEGEPVVNYLMQFEDVPADTWYTEAVRWAASEKIVEGYSDTAFGPTDPITREQFATILWRYAKYKGYDVSVGEDTNILSYEDAFSISEYAIPAMQWACGAGLMEGDGLKLTPKADATRAQAAALFQRFCELEK